MRINSIGLLQMTIMLISILMRDYSTSSKPRKKLSKSLSKIRRLRNLSEN